MEHRAQPDASVSEARGKYAPLADRLAMATSPFDREFLRPGGAPRRAPSCLCPQASTVVGQRRVTHAGRQLAQRGLAGDRGRYLGQAGHVREGTPVTSADDLDQLYLLLDELSVRLGGPRLLSQCVMAA